MVNILKDLDIVMWRILLLVLLLSGCSQDAEQSSASNDSQDTQSRPNILLIVAD